MKAIVLSIFLILIVVCGWRTTKEYELQLVNTEEATSEIVGSHSDPMITALTVANSFADVTVRTVSYSFSQIVRRYRPSGMMLENLFTCLNHQQGMIGCETLKTFLRSSQEHAANLKDHGYYIYALRELII